MANNVTQLQQTVNNLGAIVVAIKKNEDDILKRVEKLEGNSKIIHAHDEKREIEDAKQANNGVDPVPAQGCSLPCTKAELIEWIQYAVHQEFFILAESIIHEAYIASPEVTYAKWCENNKDLLEKMASMKEKMDTLSGSLRTNDESMKQLRTDVGNYGFLLNNHNENHIRTDEKVDYMAKTFNNQSIHRKLMEWVHLKWYKSPVAWTIVFIYAITLVVLCLYSVKVEKQSTAAATHNIMDVYFRNDSIYNSTYRQIHDIVEDEGVDAVIERMKKNQRMLKK